MRVILPVPVIVASLLAMGCEAAWAESTCYGTPGKGSIEAAVQLPDHGANFSAYSSLGVTLGRTYVQVFDPPYLPKLFATRHGKFLQQDLNFMKGAAWVRHDEHYHVDFGVPCKPYAG